MPITERGRWASTVLDERGRRVFGGLTEQGNSVFGVTSIPSNSIVYDMFTGTDGTLLSAHTPDKIPTGVSWSTTAIQITSNRAKGINTASDNDAFITSGMLNMVAKVNIYGVSFNGSKLYFRATNNSNCMYVSVNPNGISLVKKAGSATTLASYTGSIVDGTEVAVQVDGDSITVKLNGTSVITVTETYNNTVAIQGIGSFKNNESFDNFTVELLPNVLFYDSFTGPDNDPLSASWTTLVGGFKIKTGSSESTQSNQNAAVVESGAPNVGIKGSHTSTGNGSGLIFRATDVDNYFQVFMRNDGFTQLFRRQAGATTSLGSLTTTYVSGTILEAVLQDSGIVIKYGGTQLFSVTDTFNQTATKHGMGSFFTTPVFNDFTITSATVTGTTGSTNFATKQVINQTSSVLTATKQVINQTGAVTVSTKQAIYTTGSTNFATQQVLTQGAITGSTNFATKQVLFQTTSSANPTKQVIFLTSSTLMNTQQKIGQVGSSLLSTKQVINQLGSLNVSTKQVLFQTSAANFGTKQSLYLLTSTNYPTKQQITFTGTLGIPTQQRIYLIGTNPVPTKQRIFMTTSSLTPTKQRFFQPGVSTFNLTQIIYNPEQQILHDISLTGGRRLNIQLEGARKMKIELRGGV